MVGEAGLAARQLELKEPLPITITESSNSWNVLPPPGGVGGSVVTSNYIYTFEKGRLVWIKKRDWEQTISPALTNLAEWVHQTSLVDSNGAHQLAARWLGSLSVDVGRLEQQNRVNVRQQRISIPPATEGRLDGGSQMPVPFFDVKWGRDPVAFGSGFGQVSVTLLGTTKELLQLHIRDFSVFKGVPFQLTNAADLLGPLPPPRHFVEELLGGSDAYQTVATPDRVEAWLLNSYSEQREHANKKIRSGELDLKPAVRKMFVNTLLDFDSYEWGAGKLCSPDYGLRLRFLRGRDVVEILFCYDCDILQITHAGRIKEENFDFAHNKLVEAIQRAFPKDEIVRALKTNDEKQSRGEYQSMLNSIER